MQFIKILTALVLLTFSGNANAKNLKNIVIIATGGTISGAGDSAVGSKYSSSKVAIDKIVKTVPGVENLANVKSEQLIQISSQNIDEAAWLKIAARVNEILSQYSVDGVVITHGTDTLEETAYFLNLVIKSKKPVVVVGAMRPSTSLSADGALNLYNAVALASSKEAHGKGVLVLMNDDIFAARDVSKTSTIKVEAFKSNNSGAIGYVYYGKPEIYYEPIKAHTSQTIFNTKKLKSLPKVDIIYAYSGHEPSVIDHLVESGSKAIIVAGVGDGNVNDASLERLIEARKKGIIIVRSARVGTGFVVPNVEIEDDELGFVTANNLSPQKARILAMMALTKTEDVKKIKEIFAKY
jgi:L-asparaginase